MLIWAKTEISQDFILVGHSNFKLKEEDNQIVSSICLNNEKRAACSKVEVNVTFE
jgi:hypothetical protein